MKPLAPKIAPSTYTLNWRAICKNTLYCALKNYSGPMAMGRLASRIVARLARKHMAEILRWWTGGKLNTGQMLQSEYACVRGMVSRRHERTDTATGLRRPCLIHGTTVRSLCRGK